MRERSIYPQDCPRTVRSRRNRCGNTELACSPKYHVAKTACAVGRQSGINSNGDTQLPVCPGLVKEGEQLGIDLVFQGRAHAVRPAGTILSLAPFTSLAEGSAESVTQHSPAFRHEGRELALKLLSCTAAPAVSDGR